MMLQWTEMSMDIELQENEVNVIVLEGQDMYAKILEDFMVSIESAEGKFFLYDSDKKLNISKCVELIFSPLLLNLNNKRIQSYLYKELKAVSDEVFYELKEKVNGLIVNYLDNLSQKLPYPLSYNLNFDETVMFKQYDIKIEYEAESLFEKMVNYIQISSSLCQTKVLILVNAKAYFSVEELGELYKIAFYNKMHLLMIENRKYNCVLEEKYYIIDRDKCLIIQE